MSNNEDKKLGKLDYFELREKRLKLVYKILYVVAAIWIAIFLGISQIDLKNSEIPIYAFLLSVSSMVIIQIIKYAIMEFRCMKIVGQLNEELMNQTESRYENIWMSFSLILSFGGLALICHFKFVEEISIMAFLIVFLICMTYFTVLSFFKIFKKNWKNKTIKILDVFDVLIGYVATYSLCAVTCLITSTVVMN